MCEWKCKRFIIHLISHAVKIADIPCVKQWLFICTFCFVNTVVNNNRPIIELDLQKHSKAHEICVINICY